MSKTRIALMIVAIVIAFAGIVYIGLNSLSYFIYESRSCKWANIDNIELRTNIDIPKTLECSCSYSKETDSKTAIFTLDLDSVAILKYAEKNGFTPSDTIDDQFIFQNLDHNIVAVNILQKNGLHPERESYKILLDPSSKKLYVSLQYLN